MESLDVISEAFKEGDFGLFTDFDGTLSHIASTPDEAFISSRARESLAAISTRLKLVAVISGRSLDDIRKLVGLSDITYVGNHGLEMWIDGYREDAVDTTGFQRRLSDVKAAVEPLLKEKGVFLEDKGVTASIHFRLNPNPREIEKKLFDTLEPFEGLRFVQGKMTVNIMPLLEVNKGSVVRKLTGRFALKSAIYLGDDVTDIDAFKAIKEASNQPDFKGFAVAVIGNEAPPQLAQEAEFTLDGIEGVEAFLSWMQRQAAPPIR